MSDMEENQNEVYALQANLTGEAASQLADDLMALDQPTIKLNASTVERIDTPSVQVLVSASKLWADRNGEFEIIEPSETLSSAFQHLGLETYLNGGN